MVQTGRFQFYQLAYDCLGSFYASTPILSLTVLYTILIPYSGEVENWCNKSDYVINAGPTYVRKRWPSSVTGVAWHGCSRDRGACEGFRVRFRGGGGPPFYEVSVKNEIVTRSDSKPGLGTLTRVNVCRMEFTE